MDIVIVNKRCASTKVKGLEEDGYVVFDVTSSSKDPNLCKFSPFYPHGSIAIDGHVSESVEGMWQGLKVFENHGIDESKFAIRSMKNLKRTTRKFGKVLGHMYNKEVIGYVQARKLIFLPAYEQVLNKLSKELCDMKQHTKIVLLDYNTNENIEDVRKPLSHASLIKTRLLETNLGSI